MFRFSLFLMVVTVLFASPSYATVYNDRSQTYRAQFVNRKPANLRRQDPRLKYLQSRKANSCLRSPSGVCTIQEHESFVPSKYNNTMREKELNRQRRIRPWL